MGRGCSVSLNRTQHSVMKSNLPLSLTRKVYNQYGSETCSLTKALKQKLQIAQGGIERIMLGITWRDRRRSSWIREQIQSKERSGHGRDIICAEEIIDGLSE